jgi:hypothetical protein
MESSPERTTRASSHFNIVYATITTRLTGSTKGGQEPQEVWVKGTIRFSKESMKRVLLLARGRRTSHMELHHAALRLTHVYIPVHFDVTK